MTDIRTDLTGFNEIRNALEEVGFVFESPDTLTKVVRQRRVVVVNGQQVDASFDVKVQFVYLGEGYIESEDGSRETTYGMSLRYNDQIMTEFWVRDSKELFSWLKN